MPAQFFAAVLVISKLVTIKGALMSADYLADIPQLLALRTEARALSGDRELGYLADYWSGYASWRIIVNGSSSQMAREVIKENLDQAVADFESSISKKSDFADGWASAAAVHGWLAALNAKTDPAEMTREIEIFKRDISRALELEPNNPRVLWIQAVPFRVMPADRGGDLDRAIGLYKKMIDSSRPLDPSSPMPDWGKAEALMSLASAESAKTSPDLDAAMSNLKEAVRLQPEWHYPKDILMPQIEAKQRQQAFDYLLGDWEFTGTNQQRGAMHGYWTAVRIDETTLFDEFRILGDHDETYYVTRTVRAFNPGTNVWELMATEKGAGLQNRGTAVRENGEVHIEQTIAVGTGKPALMRIRYYDIHPDHFSWVADRSNDNGKTWVTDYQKLDVRRIGPEKSFALTAAKEAQH